MDECHGWVKMQQERARTQREQNAGKAKSKGADMHMRRVTRGIAMNGLRRVVH